MIRKRTKDNDLYIALCIMYAMDLEEKLYKVREEHDLSWDTISLRCLHETLEEIASLTTAEA
jgi:hypothetical protein